MEPNNPYDAPSQSAPEPRPPARTRSVTVKTIDVLSAGLMLGALYALIGLIVGAIFSLLAIVGVAAGGGGGDAALGGIITGVGALVLLPLIYGFGGFVGGIIVALLYNVVAGFVGGVRVDLEG